MEARKMLKMWVLKLYLNRHLVVEYWLTTLFCLLL